MNYRLGFDWLGIREEFFVLSSLYGDILRGGLYLFFFNRLFEDQWRVNDYRCRGIALVDGGCIY